MSSASTRQTDAPPPEPGPQWLVVRQDGEYFGIPVEQVLEVVRPEGLVPVPGAPVIQAGVVNVRGAIVTVLDLRALRTGARAVAAGSIVLLQHGARPVGLSVDAVHEVRAAGESTDAGLVPLDAAALVAGHLHSAEERGR